MAVPYLFEDVTFTTGTPVRTMPSNPAGGTFTGNTLSGLHGLTGINLNRTSAFYDSPSQGRDFNEQHFTGKRTGTASFTVNVDDSTRYLTYIDGQYLPVQYVKNVSGAAKQTDRAWIAVTDATPTINADGVEVLTVTGNLVYFAKS